MFLHSVVYTNIPRSTLGYITLFFCSHNNPHQMEEAHLSLAEKISQGVCLDSLPYVDTEVCVVKKW